MEQKRTPRLQRGSTVARLEQRAHILEALAATVRYAAINQHLAIDLDSRPIASLLLTQAAEWIQNLLACKPILPPRLLHRLKDVRIEQMRCTS